MNKCSIILLFLFFIIVSCEDKSEELKVESPSFELDKDVYYEGKDTIRFSNINVSEEYSLFANIKFPSGERQDYPLEADEKGFFLPTNLLYESGLFSMRLYYSELTTFSYETNSFDDESFVSDITSGRFRIDVPTLSLVSSGKPLFRSEYFDVEDSIVLEGERLLNQEWKLDPFVGEGASFVLAYGDVQGGFYTTPFGISSVQDDKIVIKFSSESGNLILGSPKELYIRSEKNGKEIFKRVASLSFQPTGKVIKKNVSINNSGNYQVGFNIPTGGIGTQNLKLYLNEVLIEKAAIVAPRREYTSVYWNLPENTVAGTYEVRLTVDDMEVQFIGDNTINIIE